MYLAWYDIKKVKVIDCSKVDKEEYLLAMERSSVKDVGIRLLLESALIDKVNDRIVYMEGIYVSYQYEGYNTYSMEELDKNGLRVFLVSDCWQKKIC